MRHNIYSAPHLHMRISSLSSSTSILRGIEDVTPFLPTTRNKICQTNPHRQPTTHTPHTHTHPHAPPHTHTHTHTHTHPHTHTHTHTQTQIQTHAHAHTHTHTHA